MYINTYWNLNRDYTPINETVETVNLTVTFQTLSMFKWQMYSAQVYLSHIMCHHSVYLCLFKSVAITLLNGTSEFGENCR